MSEMTENELAAEDFAIRERVAKMALTDPNPAWAIARALFQIGDGIEDVGNQLYAIGEVVREKGHE